MTLKINTLYNKYAKILLVVLAIVSIQGTCRYSLKDVSIPPEIKTVRVFFIENKARYINPQLSPKLSDKLRQKNNQPNQAFTNQQ